MKTRNKILYASAALLLIGIGSFQFSQSNSAKTFGGLNIPKDIKIEKVAIGENGETFRVDQIGPKGETLELRITKQEIHIPWTLYIPCYQFGTISGRLVYDAQVVDNHWTSLSVSVTESTTRYAIIPKLFRADEIKSELVNTLLKAIEVRISESQK
jgi:hypothetical protein